MKNVQVRDVPESVVNALRCTAANRGESLQRYLLSVLTEQADVDINAAVLAEAREDADDAGTSPFDAAEVVRAAREERDAELMTRLDP